MNRSSAVARLQQFTTIGLLSAALAWFWWRWPDSPFAAMAGFVLIAFGYSMFLGLEFIALRFVGRADPAPRPTWAELLRAWWGETMHAPLVFCWRQPFRWSEVPDQVATRADGLRGVVFIHGFLCNRGFWNPWLRRMRDQDRPFVAVNLEPVFGSIESYVCVVEEAVQRLQVATGRAPVLVCHSMGGLAARAWLRANGGSGRIERVVTIGSPHRGTWLGRFSHLPNGRQMRLESEWLVGLARHAQAAPAVPFTCWYSNCDNIVFPASTATLDGADNRFVRGAAHVQLAFMPEVVEGTLALLD